MSAVDVILAAAFVGQAFLIGYHGMMAAESYIYKDYDEALNSEAICAVLVILISITGLALCPNM